MVSNDAPLWLNAAITVYRRQLAEQRYSDIGHENMTIGGIVTRGTSTERENAVVAYVIIFVLQISALCFSHQIINWKTTREEGSMMPAGKQYHVFATHKKEKKQTEHLVVHMKDTLEQKGIKVLVLKTKLAVLNRYLILTFCVCCRCSSIATTSPLSPKTS
jgi:hypothetical protein